MSSKMKEQKDSEAWTLVEVVKRPNLERIWKDTLHPLKNAEKNEIRYETKLS